MVSPLGKREKGILLYHLRKELLLWTTKTTSWKQNSEKALGSFLPEKTLCIVDLNLNLLLNQ
jgi:hypothetical protein